MSTRLDALAELWQRVSARLEIRASLAPFNAAGDERRSALRVRSVELQGRAHGAVACGARPENATDAEVMVVASDVAADLTGEERRLLGVQL